MQGDKRIQSALISVYHKEGLEPVLELLQQLNIKILSTGGTFNFIKSKGYDAEMVEDFTTYPSILGGRVKTLHPKVFGGILFRRENANDLHDCERYQIPSIDLVIVDLYPFENTLKETDDENEIIEKIDVGGISLIRAAAKNFNDVLVVASRKKYNDLLNLLKNKKGYTAKDDRKHYASHAFAVSSGYDTTIFNYFNREAGQDFFRKSYDDSSVLRYGENPHQKGVFYGNMKDVFTQVHGKAISYNNLVDLDAALQLISEFNDPTYAILKHTNACGLACRKTLPEAWKDALAGDPVSAFGGVIIVNREVDESSATELNKLFFEIIAAPSFQKNALEILKTRKNRIILELNNTGFPDKIYKSVLNGVLEQDRDSKTEGLDDMQVITGKKPEDSEIQDLIFANKIVKHTKSNTIVLVKDRQLIGSGTGQTSRVDALKQAVNKAGEFGFNLQGAVMASDAFFPFADSVELAHKAGITAVIQPGGSVRDQESIDYCNNNGMSMVFTGTRHFKH